MHLFFPSVPLLCATLDLRFVPSSPDIVCIRFEVSSHLQYPLFLGLWRFSHVRLQLLFPPPIQHFFSRSPAPFSFLVFFLLTLFYFSALAVRERAPPPARRTFPGLLQHKTSPLIAGPWAAFPYAKKKSCEFRFGIVGGTVKPEA